jgi:signal recognition particle subunit SRP54
LKEREVDYTAEVKAEAPVMVTNLPKRNRKVLLAAADVYRPAAITQLEILGDSVGVEVFSMGTEADPVDIAQAALEKAKADGFDTLVVDTAGRQVIDDKLMAELQRIQKIVKPDETLLVVDAMTGQEAASLTAAFDSAIGLTGAILTKMDGDSRGGAAVSVRGVSGKPIKFIGVGERTVDLEPFYPDRMASRILGMGDVLSIVEKAVAAISEEDSARLTEKARSSQFDFNDFLQQARAVKTMGNIGKLAKMMPGMGGLVSDDQLIAAEKRLKKNEAMIECMTAEERANPDFFIRDKKSRERIQRLADETGFSTAEVQAFISEFQKTRTMMSRMIKQADAMGSNSDEGSIAMPGNRAARRASKKKIKVERGGGGGFG